MPTQKSAWVYVDLSPNIAVANTDEIKVAASPVAGTIKEVWIGINTLLTTSGGTLAVANGSANVLSSTTYNLGAAGDLVAATPESATLNTGTKNLEVSAGSLLKATWVLTTAAITNAATCIVAIEPATW
jgi:hypothetical protein